MYGNIDAVHTPFFLIYKHLAKETFFLYFNPKISYTFVFAIS